MTRDVPFLKLLTRDKLYKPNTDHSDMDGKLEDIATSYQSEPYESRLGRIARNPYVRASAAVVAAAVTLPLFADGNGETYGFLSGLADGALSGINVLFCTFGDGNHTWAQDGNGIVSSPNVWHYWLGYLITGGAEMTVCGAISAKQGD
jgi:hypothetical protein